MAAPLDLKNKQRAAKFGLRSRDGSSVGDALKWPCSTPSIDTPLCEPRARSRTNGDSPIHEGVPSETELHLSSPQHQGKLNPSLLPVPSGPKGPDRREGLAGKTCFTA